MNARVGCPVLCIDAQFHRRYYLFRRIQMSEDVFTIQHDEWLKYLAELMRKSKERDSFWDKVQIVKIRDQK